MNDEKSNALLTLALMPAGVMLGFLMLWPTAWALNIALSDLMPWVRLSSGQTLYAAGFLQLTGTLFLREPTQIGTEGLGPFGRLIARFGIQMVAILLTVAFSKLTAFMLGAFGVSAV